MSFGAVIDDFFDFNQDGTRHQQNYTTPPRGQPKISGSAKKASLPPQQRQNSSSSSELARQRSKDSAQSDTSILSNGSPSGGSSAGSSSGVPKKTKSPSGGHSRLKGFNVLKKLGQGGALKNKSNAKESKRSAKPSVSVEDGHSSGGSDWMGGWGQDLWSKIEMKTRSTLQSGRDVVKGAAKQVENVLSLRDARADDVQKEKDDTEMSSVMPNQPRRTLQSEDKENEAPNTALTNAEDESEMISSPLKSPIRIKIDSVPSESSLPSLMSLIPKDLSHASLSEYDEEMMAGILQAVSCTPMSPVSGNLDVLEAGIEKDFEAAKKVEA